jgi:transposase
MKVRNFNVPSFHDQKFFIGIDVHKKQWYVTIRSSGIELRTFSMNPSPEELYSYMMRHYPGGLYYSVYEAGFCGYWIHRRLRDYGIRNIIVHPPDIPTSQKEKLYKRDAIDSRKLSKRLEEGSIHSIYIPQEADQQLRSLSRLRYQIAKNQVRIKNRIKGFLHYNGVSIPTNDEMTHWSGYFLDWLESLEFAHESSRAYLDLCLEELRENRRRLSKLIRYLRRLCDSYGIKDTVRLLITIPGIGFITAISFYGEVLDIHRFGNFNQLAAFVGLIPISYSSDEKKIDRGMTKRRNKYLRNLIIESAWIAARKDPYLTHRFARLTSRMKKQNAIIRIARNLLRRMYHVWKYEEPYQEGLVYS